MCAHVWASSAIEASRLAAPPRSPGTTGGCEKRLSALKDVRGARRREASEERRCGGREEGLRSPLRGVRETDESGPPCRRGDARSYQCRAGSPPSPQMRALEAPDGARGSFTY